MNIDLNKKEVKKIYVWLMSISTLDDTEWTLYDKIEQAMEDLK